MVQFLNLFNNLKDKLNFITYSFLFLLVVTVACFYPIAYKTDLDFEVQTAVLIMSLIWIYGSLLVIGYYYKNLTSKFLAYYKLEVIGSHSNLGSTIIKSAAHVASIGSTTIGLFFEKDDIHLYLITAIVLEVGFWILSIILMCHHVIYSPKFIRIPSEDELRSL
jgi:hypothetical protein